MDHHLLTTAIFVVVVALYGYGIYGTVVMTRILRDVERESREAQAMTREVLRRLPDSR